MEPTLETIQNALRWDGCPERWIPDWSAWLHENYHAERPELRRQTFGHLLRLIANARAKTPDTKPATPE